MLRQVSLWSVLVPVTFVRGVTVSVVEIVDVIAVFDGLVAAISAVDVGVIVVGRMRGRGTLVPMFVVRDVHVSIVEVVDVVAMFGRGVAAVGVVRVGVVVVSAMLGRGHRRGPFRMSTLRCGGWCHPPFARALRAVLAESNEVNEVSFGVKADSACKLVGSVEHALFELR